MEKIILATRNKNKIGELKHLLADMPVQVVTFTEVPDFPEVVEDGATFRENALKKAREVSRVTGLAALADDSGLEVDVIRGQPGVRSARFAGEKATDAENNEKLLTLLRNVTPGKRGAQFRCVAAMVFPSGKEIVVDETCRGKIILQPQGENGFGYDPLFLFPYYGKTFAELDLGIKNKISHRAKALQKIKEELGRYLKENAEGKSLNLK